MKKIVLFSAVAAMVLASCAGNPEGKKAETTDSIEVANVINVGTALPIDTSASKVVWKGTKVTGSHEGTIAIKSGTISVDNNQITAGEFILDMNTISSTDLDGEYKEKLDGHLKADDFFSVASHPESSFVITGVKQGATANDYVISGNLTIKGITKNITFDAKVEEISEFSVTATADFNILREDWGVSYEGKKDDLISKEINFKVTIVAKK